MDFSNFYFPNLRKNSIFLNQFYDVSVLTNPQDLSSGGKIYIYIPINSRLAEMERWICLGFMRTNYTLHDATHLYASEGGM